MATQRGLAEKLGIAPGQRICLLDATPDTAEVVRAACGGAVVVDDALDGAARYDALFLWPHVLEGLAALLAALAWRIAPDGALWVVMPRKAVARRRGLGFTWEQMQALALTTDLVDNKIVSLTAEEYATRFVIRKERRAAYLDAVTTREEQG